MPDDSALPWTDRQWADLRGVALEAARKSRVASTFLPLVGPLPADQVTVESNWMSISDEFNAGTGEKTPRLAVRAGRTLHLVTIACNLYLRSSEIVDPDLDAAKSMIRRAGEVLGRLEDAVVFHGLPRDANGDFDGIPVQPKIYSISGGTDLLGLLHAPDESVVSGGRGQNAPQKLSNLLSTATDYVAAGDDDQPARQAYDAAEDAAAAADLIMSVRLDGGRKVPIVDAVVDAIQKLERRGHFGPFAVVLGHRLFSDATTPTKSLVLPTDRIAEFLGGPRVLRSGLIEANRGVVVALGGQPVELVLATDIDVRFLQATLEPRYVLRVVERLVLRIKELDAVCGLVAEGTLLDHKFLARRVAG